MVKPSDVLDVFALAAVAGGLGYRFGWWLSFVVVGALVMLANWARAS